MATPQPQPDTATANSAGAAATIQSSSSDRISAHTHITGLGLDAQGFCLPNENTDCGLVGQTKAREAAGLVVDLIRESSFAGRALLLVGPPGTGKTAIALAMAKELGSHVPFSVTTASQMYSQEVQKTELLTQQFRKAIGLRIREQKEVYEGEVTELTVQETQDPLSNSATSYGKSISHVLLTLKTTKGTKTLKLDPTMYTALMKEQVHTGDVIYLEANSGAVKRVGRSDRFAAEYDLESEEYVALPKGDVHKKKTVVQDVTLHDLDVANAQPPSHNHKTDNVVSLVASLGRPKRKTEITDKLRNEVNKVVQRYMDEGVAELVPGVLFLDEVHMLDAESFSFLHRGLESNFSPIVVLATNRGWTKIRDTTVWAPHGLPVDLLDRLLLVPTHPYTLDEIRQIVQIRGQREGLQIDTEALGTLASIGARTSLRYAVQLLTPARIMAETVGRTTVQSEDVASVEGLFMDGKASAQWLMSEHGQDYLT